MGKKKDDIDLEAAVMAGVDPYDDEDFEADPAARGDELSSQDDEDETTDREEGSEEGSEGEDGDEGTSDAEEGEGEETSKKPDSVESEGDDQGHDDEDQREDRREKSGARKDEPRIPKSRFDEVNERRKAAERRLKELEESAKAAEKGIDFDFEAKEAEYMEAVLDGDREKALAIRREIRAAESKLYEQRAQQTASQTREQTKAELELQRAIEEAKSQYPAFDDTSEAYSQDLTDEALELFNGFVAQKYEPAAAMRKATRMVAKLYGLDAASSGESADESAERPHQTRPKSGQVERKLKTAQRQPPQPSSRTEDRALDVMRMPESEFEKLTEAELRRLRGDMI